MNIVKANPFVLFLIRYLFERLAYLPSIAQFEEQIFGQAQ